MDREIGDSVGDAKKGAVNRDHDVRTVQGLLNIKIVKDRRSDRFLAVDGRIDSNTLSAIRGFQRRSSLPESGLINRSDATIQALTRFSDPSRMTVSDDLVNWLESTKGESFGAFPYNDTNRPATSNATIGFGHKLHSGPVTDADLEKCVEKYGANGMSRGRLRGYCGATWARPQTR